jgi:hypothetical protein
LHGRTLTRSAKSVAKIADDFFSTSKPYLNLLNLLGFYTDDENEEFFSYYGFDDLIFESNQWTISFVSLKKHDENDAIFNKFKKDLLHYQPLNKFAKITRVVIGKSKNSTSVLPPSLKKFLQMTKYQTNVGKLKKIMKDAENNLKNAFVYSNQTVNLQKVGTTVTILPFLSPDAFSEINIDWDRPFTSKSDVQIARITDPDRDIQVTETQYKKSLFDFSRIGQCIEEFYQEITRPEREHDKVKYSSKSKHMIPKLDESESEELKRIFGVSSSTTYKKNYGRIHSCAEPKIYDTKLRTTENGSKEFNSLDFFLDGPFSEKVLPLPNYSEEQLISTFLPLSKMQSWIQKNYRQEFDYFYSEN